MNLQTILYFISILLTCALTGLLAWYAWRQPALPGVRTYAWLALSECLMALTDIISMVSGTQAQALFWFNLRFLFTATIPVIFLAFALEYSGQKGWSSKKLLAGALVIPVITQIMLWSNSLHGLWVKHEVAFHQSGPLWIVQTSARIPGLWFLVHSFYSQILMLAGMVLIFLTAWRMRRKYRGQALLLIAGALVGLTTSLIPSFNLMPQLKFNPFIPGIGVSALLYALAIFRFQLFKRFPMQESSVRMTRLDTQEKGSLAALILIFILFTSGIAAAGYLAYQNYEKQFRAQVESELSVIVELKTSELEDWRNERLADADVLYQNPVLVNLVQRYFENPADGEAQAQLQAWLKSYRAYTDYDRVRLVDSQGFTRLSDPGSLPPLDSAVAQRIPAALQSGQVTMIDFYRSETDKRIYLGVLIPVVDRNADDRIIGLITLGINPVIYLYPFIQNWPVPSESAETLLVRRDGEEVVYLNELRFEQDAALTLRFPLTNADLPAARAVLGETGIIEGVDYRGRTVVAGLHAVPDSPWFLISKMDTAEVYAPLRERLWLTMFFFGTLILAAGTGLVLIWRQQRMRYYRAQVETLEALKTSEEKFRLAFSTSPDSIAITRLRDGMFVSVNKGFEQISGYTQEETLGKTSTDINIWKDPEDRRKIVEALRAKGEVQNYGAPFLTRNGEIYGLMSASIIELNGEAHILNITRDITERKQVEEALRESEDKFKYVFDNSTIGKSITLPGGEINVNRAFCEMLGYSQEELTSRKWQEISHPDDIELTQKIVNSLLSGEKESARFTKRYLHKNGAVVWTEVGTALRRDQNGQPLYFMTTVNDITERVQAEERLAWEQYLLSALLDTLPDHIYFKDRQSRFTRISKSLADMLGSGDPTRVLGKTDFDFFTEEHARPAFEAEQSIIATGQPVIGLEEKETWPDGRVTWVDTIKMPLLDQAGNIIGTFGSSRNITERKQAEETLREYNSRLETEVDQRTRELRDAQEQLLRQERLAVLGQLAGSVGHELRNPLGVISNAIYFLKMTQPDADDIVKEYLAIIDNETRTADKIVTDLLDFTRNKSAEREPAAVSELLLQALERYPVPPSVKVVIKIAKNLPPVYADPRHAEQILGNLTINACQAMPEGGKLTLSASMEGDMILIAVRDAGTGISAENMGKLFEPLFTTKTKGIGLGLAVSRKLAESNGGRIEVQSAPGKGSTFTLYLPVYNDTISDKEAE